MATVSVDNHTKIWTKDQSDQWKLTSDFKSHEASIADVQWAHPDFGTIIATCSYDRSINIWEEVKQNPFT